MNWLDFAIIVVLVWFAYAGLSMGVIRAGIALGSALVGVLLAGRFYLRLAGDVSIVNADPTTNQLIAFVAIFAGAALAGQIVAAMLKDSVHAIQIDGTVDSLGGLICGVLQGCVLVELLLIAFSAFPAAAGISRAIDGSLLAPVFLKGVPLLLHILPSAMRRAVQAAPT